MSGECLHNSEIDGLDKWLLMAVVYVTIHLSIATVGYIMSDPVSDPAGLYWGGVAFGVIGCLAVNATEERLIDIYDSRGWFK